MSDGPHKSLPLRPRYKRFAEWAYKPAFDIPQVCEAAEAALIRDVNIEVAPVLRQLLRIADGDDLLSRHPDLVQSQLQALRDDPIVHPLAASVIECTQMAVQQGFQGRDAVQEAIGTALGERLAANARTTEEHYLMEAGPRASLSIRSRMNEAIDAMANSDSFSHMARGILGDTTANVRRAPAVRDGLDEGVQL